jgi:hypothetical protein
MERPGTFQILKFYFGGGEEKKPSILTSEWGPNSELSE